MIMAYDEGAWHPNMLILLLWSAAAFVSLYFQFALARTEVTGSLPYQVIALPVIGLFILNLYIDYGRSGDYTGEGTIGAGAHLEPLLSLQTTILECLTFGAPTIATVLLVHWQELRRRAPYVFFTLVLLLLLAQCLFGFFQFVELDPF